MEYQQNNLIRKANQNDLDEIKKIAENHKHELGFIMKPVLARSIDQGELYVAIVSNAIIGFLQYHHRRDTQTTLHNIVVESFYRKSGIGRALISELEKESSKRDKEFIQLKCPEDLPANIFYEYIGYKIVAVEDGKNRRLNIWQKPIKN
ncbi:MAG: hypothetical protein DHS20C20_19550 [Ardenticatenaceae bacterium]|nr:MAG: hypothetical protein DHS20C20_19550 [Ardenticatenaceae bacterium]